MLSNGCANCAVVAYLQAFWGWKKFGLRMLDKSPAKSANDGFCWTVWDLTRILISVHYLLTLLNFVSISFHFHRSYVFILFFPIDTCYWKRANIFLETTVSQTEKDSGVWQKPPIWSSFQMLLRCLISFLKRIRDVSGSRPETGFPRMSGCNKRRRKNKRCHLAPATVFRKDFGSHQEGLIFFLIQNQKKENFCSIFVKKKYFIA